MQEQVNLQWNDRAARQLVSYEALFDLLTIIQPLEDIYEISRIVAQRWKQFANVGAWRVVIPMDEGFTVIDGFRGEASVHEEQVISEWDANICKTLRPCLLRLEELQDEPPPPKHLTGKGVVEIEIIPFFRGNRTIGVLTVAGRHSRFTEMDKRFTRLFGSFFIDKITHVLQRQLAMEVLRHKASRDALTGLLNRGAVIERLEIMQEMAKRSNKLVSVVFGDIDYFKDLNDTYGHLIGDEVLKEVSRRLETIVRASDHLGRYGGEEFLIVLYSCNGEEAVLAAERLRRVIEGSPIQIGNSNYEGVLVTMSFGTAVSDPEETVKSLLSRADKALYLSKTRGRNCVTAAVQ